ncbi:MAG: hypothetical protein LBD21_01635 [Tannerellaceae bacterium]|jgi:hypothetical protein|nr:hypothetical protein [Tannerellaceae bacterium]
MKTEDVPQDNKYLGSTTIRDLYYAVDDSGQYVPVASTGWEPQNEALRITWDAIGEEAEAIRQEVLAGRKSPLAYHMEIHLMTPALLASYTGLNRKDIKRHLSPAAFAALDDYVLGRYAEAFGIDVNELKSLGHED